MKLDREEYLKQIRPFYDTDIIKVISGVRRSGKSVLMDTVRDELLNKGVSGSHIISINFEDLDYDFLRDIRDIDKEISSRITDGDKYYIFLDEIQHIDSFERLLASLRSKHNCSIFVTGSDAAMLSGELATLLTGRTVEFEIFPFSFKESVDYLILNKKECDPYEFINDYIKWGGFPLRFDFQEEDSIKRYLENLYTNILKRDIFRKSSRIDKKTFEDISKYMLANAGKEFSAQNISNYYKSNAKRSVSSRTVYTYLEKLKMAYMIHSCPKYDISGKKSLDSKEKFYAVDTGMRMINTNRVNYEDTFYLENIIYNELRIQGYDVYSGYLRNGEIDFVAVKGGKKCFLQVSYLLASEATIKREFGAYDRIRDASPKYVLSLDRMDLSQNGIEHINIVDFLMHEIFLHVT